MAWPLDRIGNGEWVQERPRVQSILDFIAGRFPLECSTANFRQVPQVRVYRSTAKAITTATLTAVDFDTERWDLGTAAGMHSTSANTTRLTCVVPGLHAINGHVLWEAVVTGSNRIALIRLNGAKEIGDQNGVPSAATNTHTSVATQYRLAAGDYVELCVYHDRGSNLNVLASDGTNNQTSTDFAMHWVSP